MENAPDEVTPLDCARLVMLHAAFFAAAVIEGYIQRQAAWLRGKAVAEGVPVTVTYPREIVPPRADREAR